MLREMEAQPDANVIAVLDEVVEQTVKRMYQEIEVDTAGIERVREAAKEGTLVLLPSHKSHIDYIVLTYVLYHHHLQVPVIAAGDNLNFAPMGPILRRAGAFFIRRSFKGDRLYRAVVDAYMRKLLRDGWPLEFFLEGGRSRTGKLLPPKLGLLNIVVDAALGLSETKTFFVPISIGYERLVEEEAFVQRALRRREIQRGRARPARHDEAPLAALRSPQRAVRRDPDARPRPRAISRRPPTGPRARPERSSHPREGARSSRVSRTA